MPIATMLPQLDGNWSVFATVAVSNQVLKSSMTPRRPEHESGAFLNINCSNLSLIGQKLVSFCYRKGFQPSFEILNDS